jgi:hypothetical protein
MLRELASVSTAASASFQSVLLECVNKWKWQSRRSQSRSSQYLTRLKLLWDCPSESQTERMPIAIWMAPYAIQTCTKSNVRK